MNLMSIERVIRMRIKKAVEMSEKGGDNFWKNSFLYNISQQIEYINSYPDFIDKMYDRAKAQSSSSIFGDESSFSYKKSLQKHPTIISGLKNNQAKPCKLLMLLLQQQNTA